MLLEAPQMFLILQGTILMTPPVAPDAAGLFRMEVRGSSHAGLLRGVMRLKRGQAVNWFSLGHSSCKQGFLWLWKQTRFISFPGKIFVSKLRRDGPVASKIVAPRFPAHPHNVERSCPTSSGGELGAELEGDIGTGRL
jgi:hypothetical protein